MTLDMENLMESIMDSLDRVPDIPLEELPNIDLYMDQLTTYMDEKLSHTTRYPGTDKVLTKTMINNYAKNDLLPPPVRKKYSRDHLILLIFIYCYKNILSIGDVQKLLKPLNERFHISDTEELTLSDIYSEILEIEKGELPGTRQDIKDKFSKSLNAFAGAPEEYRERMQRFAFISMLAYDVYIKRLLIEKMVDSLGGEDAGDRKKHRKKKEDK